MVVGAVARISPDTILRKKQSWGELREGRMGRGLEAEAEAEREKGKEEGRGREGKTE